MKAKWLLLPMAALTVAAAVYGGYTRSTLTDYTSGENWKDNFVVAGLLDSFGIEFCEQMKEYLPRVPYILRVEVLEDLEVLFGAAQQKVAVKQVYAGEGLEVGQEIYLSRSGWGISFVQPYSIERQYVNIMEVGREYLVFLSDPLDKLTGDLPVFSLFGDTIIAPAFCCDEIENTIAPIEGDTLYVAYDQVKENEFFGADQAALDAWAQTKQKLLEMYGL